MQNENAISKSQKQVRSSNFELLRILSMLMIVASHAAQHAGKGGFSILAAKPSLNVLSAILLGTYGQLGVFLFIIISSWFLCDKQEIHIKKVINLYLQTMICSILIFFVIKIFNFEPVGIKELIKAVLTPIYSGYWFIRSYIFFYLLVPFLQNYLQNAQKKQIEKLLITLTILLPVFRFFLFVEEFGNTGDFIYVFIAVFYLKKNPNNFIEKHARLICPILLILMWAVLFLMNLIFYKLNFLPERTALFILQHIFAGRNIFVFLLALSVFYIFKNYVKIGHSKLINAIAGTTFGVYIFHENSLFCSYGERGIGETALLFEQWLKIGVHFENDRFFALYFISCVLLVFAVCSVLEFLRQGIVKLFLKIRNKA